MIAGKHIEVLIPPDGGNRKTTARLDRRPLRLDRRVFPTDAGRELYRSASRRSSPCSLTPSTTGASERFPDEGLGGARRMAILMATHNLVKLHRHPIGSRSRLRGRTWRCQERR